ncbi:MAG: dihydrolipoyllysine-residue acetyltransferase [Candidatus Symbiodolus clandestinus]
MSTQTLYLPNVGSDAVEVMQIFVAVGDQIVVEQPLIVVEGDKVSMEIPAAAGGCIQDLTVQVGDKIRTGAAILQLSGDVQAVAAQVEKAPVVAPASLTVATEKEVALVAELPVTSTTESPISMETVIDNSAYVYASPLVRRMAREFGIDLSRIIGSGPKGRIVPEDLQIYVKSALQRAANITPGVSTEGPSGLQLLPWPQVDFSQFGDVERQDLSRINRATGANLHRNWVQIPHVTQGGSADITELEAFRQQQNNEPEQQKLGIKLTPLVFILLAVAKALQRFPRFNSSLSTDGQQLILKKYVHLGIAVDTPNGLVVPVIRDVDQQGLWQLAQTVAQTSQRARAGQLTPADMQGGCFTISSLGGIGGTTFTPIINAPEVAILGVSKAMQQPQWNGQQFIPRLMLPLSLSYDHRVIDGAEGARFMTTLERLLADTRRLLL